MPQLVNRVRRADLNPAILRHIQFLEVSTRRKCLRLWREAYETRAETYLFGGFYNGLDRSIYTVAYEHPRLKRWIPA